MTSGIKQFLKRSRKSKLCSSKYEKYPDPQELGNHPKLLVGFQEVKCHMIFNIKLDGPFTWKARYVAGGHTTDTPASITYSSVVSRESVGFTFLLASLLDLKVLAADIGNVYIKAPCHGRMWCEAGPEFGVK